MGKLLRGNRSFQPSTAFDRETRHFADQMTDLCMKCNSGLKSDKISLFILEWWKESVKLHYILFFIWATYDKASSRFSKASFSKSANSISRWHFSCSLDENRNFSLLQNDNSTSLLPDLISTDIFCFIVSIDSMRSFWKTNKLFVVSIEWIVFSCPGNSKQRWWVASWVENVVNVFVA